MDNLKFGAFIAERRKEKGWTQKTLAEKINVTDKAVSKWERGLGFPDIKTIEPLANALEISVLEIIRSEKIEGDHISTTVATAAMENMIGVAVCQKEICRRNLVIIAVLLVSFVMVLFLIDTMEWIGFLMVCLPVITLAVGILLLLVSWIKYKRGTPWWPTMIIGVLAISYPLFIWALLVLAGAVGVGPIPN